jgi:hypothetical protein
VACRVLQPDEEVAKWRKWMHASVQNVATQ